jgi:DNA-binding transcriptional ArsR family regulator
MYTASSGGFAPIAMRAVDGKAWRSYDRRVRLRDHGTEIWLARISIDIRPKIHNHMVVDRLGTTFAALSDPTRRAMIERLSRGPASVHGLTERFALSQQMISKHVACLVRARIVIKTKRGRESICTLRPKAIKTVSDWAISYRQFWEERFDKLDMVVNQMKKAEIRDDKKHGE